MIIHTYTMLETNWDNNLSYPLKKAQSLSARFTSTSFIILEEKKSNVDIAVLTCTCLQFMGEKNRGTVILYT